MIDVGLFVIEMLLALLCVIPFALFTHELGHKIVANYYGFETRIIFSFKRVCCECVKHGDLPTRLQWKVIYLAGGLFSSLMLTILFLIFRHTAILIFIPYEFARALQEYYKEWKL